MYMKDSRDGDDAIRALDGYVLLLRQRYVPAWQVPLSSTMPARSKRAS